jgi:hypothetical protein
MTSRPGVQPDETQVPTTGQSGNQGPIHPPRACVRLHVRCGAACRRVRGWDLTLELCEPIFSCRPSGSRRPSQSHLVSSPIGISQIFLEIHMRDSCTGTGTSTEFTWREYEKKSLNRYCVFAPVYREVLHSL